VTIMKAIVFALLQALAFDAGHKADGRRGSAR
jgi:hypothetical protein